ncbi:uncharacterized protein LOC130999355 [Salvia miltiorrhiza]|uniref:uncharacterized protein LOC130999355 n=1 Tax=Salvia miltiorrhiza TaxID=226208 RepID=UPI0025AC9A25|nr:uncharacterized protein LOC130999355 [Salvia miltiorrhiza]
MDSLPPPPRPRRCSEGSLIGVQFPSVRTRPYYFRRCKKVNPTSIESLFEELLMEILVRLSADDLYANVRLVCRRWYHLIHSKPFVYAHLNHTSHGLLLSHSSDYLVFITATTQGRIEVSNLGYVIRFRHVSSCNGLTVGLEFCGKYAAFIVNPATKCRFSLPPLPVGGESGFLGIAYAAASMEYKVVLTYIVDRIHKCAILTVGVDKTWRSVAIAKSIGILQTPLIIQGFMLWLLERTRIMTLNVESEVMREIHVPIFPPDYDKRRHSYCYLSTGRYLSLLIEYEHLLWQVWEMKPETGEWRKLSRNIDLRAHKCRIQQFALESQDDLQIVGWVKYPEVLVFVFRGIRRFCYYYNLGADEIHSIDVPVFGNFAEYAVHRNSLVWLS